MYFTARRRRPRPAATGPRTPPDLETCFQAGPVTLVLIASSFHCQMGRVPAELGDVFGLRRWYFVTFLWDVLRARQGYEYIHLFTHGTTIPGSAYGSCSTSPPDSTAARIGALSAVISCSRAPR